MNLLEGIRRHGSEDDPPDGKDLPAQKGVVLYKVLEKKATAADADKRLTTRRRTRLQSGKFLDSDNRFISECLFLDRSDTGWRLKLARNVRAPAACRIYDDETGEIAVGKVIWRKEAVLGVRRVRTVDPSDVTPALKTMLAGKYYAVKG